MEGNPPEGTVGGSDAGSAGAQPESAAQPPRPLSSEGAPGVAAERERPAASSTDVPPAAAEPAPNGAAAVKKRAEATSQGAEAVPNGAAPPGGATAAPAAPSAEAPSAPHASAAPPSSQAPARGASASENDHLRATVKVSARSQPRAARTVRAAGARVGAPPLPATVMNGPEMLRLLDEGRELLELDPKSAHERFEAAYRRNLNDVRVLSFYGLTLVLVEGDRQRGIRFCEEAVRRGPLSTEMLVNLAKALVLTRNKEQAVRALRKAQELAPDDPRVSSEFVALGLRRPPPIPWLPRSFFLNRWIGKLTWRWRLSHARGTSLTSLR